MSIGATEGVSYGVTSGAATSSTTGANSFGDQKVFLELMVAQMRYQDPLNPADSSEFMAQTAQFTALEKMQSVADQTALLFSSQMAFGATSMIGQTVRWYDESGVEQSGTVQGATYLSTGPMLSVDGNQVPITGVISVGEAPTITAPPPSGTAAAPPSGNPTATA